MSAVEKALLSRLTAAAPGAAIASNIIKFENYMPGGKVFTPPSTDGALWYRIWYLPGTPQAAGIGSVAPNRLSGVFQIDIMQVGIGKGTKAVDDEAIRLIACFRRGDSLVSGGQYVTIQRSYLGARGEEAPYWKQIVRVEWTADVPN